MPPTNRRQFGSLRRLPSKRWQASYWHLGARHVADRTFPAKADALAWLATVQADIQRGAWLDPAGGRLSLTEYAELWLDRRADLRPTTRAKYRHMLEVHVLPVLGAHSVATVSPSAVRDWYMDMRRRYATTGDDAYRMLRAIFATAAADAMIARSPCQVKGAGAAKSGERPVASMAEVAAAVEAMPERFQLGGLLAAWCQLRRGEILGLQRGDIEPLHGRLRIERAYVRPMRGEGQIGPPKTAAGRRTVAIPPHVVPAVEEHLGRFVAPEPTAWLFAGEGGRPATPSTLDRAWRQGRAAIGRPDLFLHDLRHSGLTWAAATGASVAELMRRGGHAHPAAALRYQHATEDRDQALAAALAGLATSSPIAARPAPEDSSSAN